jgi:hypothetical protein
MSKKLVKALESNRAGIEEGLRDAEAELAQCRAHCRELEALVARAKVALGQKEPSRADTDRTLHEAIRLVLEANGNRWMTVRELADEVNGQDLYRKRDGSKVEANQIHARAKNYASMFEKDGPRVRLRAEE